MMIEGKHIRLRTVEVEDAIFVYQLRTDRQRTEHLSCITGTVDDQKAWIGEYKKREAKGGEYYFVIESKEGKAQGLVRLYDFQGNSFSWGSWLIQTDAPVYTAIESAMLVYEFAFYSLGFENSHFQVRKGNKKVIAFHKRFGAVIDSENDGEYCFNMTKESYVSRRQRYQRYLP